MKIIIICKQHKITFLLICDCSLELIVHKQHDTKCTSYEHHYIETYHSTVSSDHSNSYLWTSQIRTILAIDEQHKVT